MRATIIVPIVKLINGNARDGDGILVDAPGQIDVVRYYHRGDQADLDLLPRMGVRLKPMRTRADVDEMLKKTRRLFAIYYATEQADPQSHHRDTTSANCVQGA